LYFFFFINRPKNTPLLYKGIVNKYIKYLKIYKMFNYYNYEKLGKQLKIFYGNSYCQEKKVTLFEKN